LASCDHKWKFGYQKCDNLWWFRWGPNLQQVSICLSWPHGCGHLCSSMCGLLFAFAWTGRSTG
jgi:hypothetical protein